MQPKTFRPVRRALRAALALALAAAALALAACGRGGASSVPASSQPGSAPATPAPAAALDLGQGLEITDVGRYAGVYVEDGSDEIVSDVLMVVLRNTGEQTLQYAQIALTSADRTANFSVTTLPPGASVVLLEQDRQTYDPAEEFTAAALSNTVFFSAEPSLQADRLTIQALDGALNVTNVSGADIPGDVTIYYKNAAEDLYYGGITYRVTISGGIPAGEIRQLMTSHFSASGSQVMFVTIAEPQA